MQSTARQPGLKINTTTDSTGLKVYGKGNEKSGSMEPPKGAPGVSSRISIDVDTREIICISLSTNAEEDGSVAVQMVKGKTGQLNSFRGDRAYDDFKVREALVEEVTQIIPPPTKMRLSIREY